VQDAVLEVRQHDNLTTGGRCRFEPPDGTLHSRGDVGRFDPDRRQGRRGLRGGHFSRSHGCRHSAVARLPHAAARIEHDRARNPRIPCVEPRVREKQWLRHRNHRRRDDGRTHRKQQEVRRPAHAHRRNRGRTHEPHARKLQGRGVVRAQQVNQDGHGDQDESPQCRG
jgi:hypothetical protein